MRRIDNAFTLVELLVVIAIISVLASMLLPVVEASIESARQVSCANSLRQVGIGNAMYRNEHAGWLPVYREDLLNRPHLYMLTGQPVPGYFFELWPDALRWCPSIQTDEVLETNGISTIYPRIHYNPLLQWGYRLPQLGSTMVGAFWGGRTYGGFSRTINPSYNDYVRIQPGRRAQRWDGATMTYYATSWDPYDAAPMACCPIWEHSVNGAPIGYLLAHSGGGAKKTSWSDPAGANALWDDGHVAWTDWPGTPSLSAYLAVVTGYAGAPETGFVNHVNIVGAFVAKRNIK